MHNALHHGEVRNVVVEIHPAGSEVGPEPCCVDRQDGGQQQAGKARSVPHRTGATLPESLATARAAWDRAAGGPDDGIPRLARQAIANRGSQRLDSMDKCPASITARLRLCTPVKPG